MDIFNGPLIFVWKLEDIGVSPCEPVLFPQEDSVRKSGDC